MSPSAPAMAVTVAGFPRVSGDEPSVADVIRAWYRFSPRERG